MALHISMWSSIQVQHSHKSQSKRNPASSTTHFLTSTDIRKWSPVMMSKTCFCFFFFLRAKCPVRFESRKELKALKKKKKKIKWNLKWKQYSVSEKIHDISLSQWGTLLREVTGQAQNILALYLKANPTAHQTPLMVSEPHEGQSCLPSLRLHFFSSAAASKPTKTW